jgi:hypothetical protein
VAILDGALGDQAAGAAEDGVVERVRRHPG